MANVQMHGFSWRGKEPHHISVGKDKSYDHTTIQAAVDAVVSAGDFDEDNPYAISVDRGLYDEVVVVAGVTDLSIIGTPGAVIRRTAALSSSPGGTVTIGDNSADENVKRIRLEGLHIVNTRNGDDEGGPPEGALYIGPETNWSTTGNFWQDVIVRGCLIEGDDDGLQIFGQNRNGGSNTGDLGRLWVQNNVIKARHDSYTIKGRIHGWSAGNQIFSANAGVNPYLDATSAWKTTGYHHNVTLGGGDDEQLGFFDSVGDQFYVIAEADESSGSQSDVAGILIYQGGKLGQVPMRHRFSGCLVRVIYDVAPAATIDNDAIAGLMVLDTCNTPDDDCLVFSGGAIHVDQRNASADAPADASGVLVTASDAEVTIVGTHIQAFNSGSGGNAYSVHVNNAGSEIKHHAFSVMATQSTAGTLTALTPLGGDAIE